MIAFAFSARAEIVNPALVDTAQAYKQTISAIDVKGQSASQVLLHLNEARKDGDAAKIVQLSETLAALSIRSSQVWLGLSKAWLKADPTADHGFAAAMVAAQLATDDRDRLEAHLVASNFLRARLEKARTRYDESAARIDNATAALAQIDTLTGDIATPDRDNPNGRVAALERTLDDARHDSKQASADVSEIAAELDEIYGEIHADMPRLDVGNMKGGDRRLEFQPELDDHGNAKISYKINGNDVNACISFSKKLKEYNRAYGSMVSLAVSDVPVETSSYDVRAEKQTLCILRLEHLVDYDVTLSADLVADDGTTLGEAKTGSIELPDIPPRIGFGDGEFILPRTGPGELPVSLTNTETFPLAIHRVVDRSLNRHLALGHIRNGIPSGEYQDLLTQFSEVLWEGTAIRPLGEKEKNNSVRTFIPVRTILDDRARWMAGLDQSSWNREGEIHSVPQPVANITDEHLSVEGSFVAGRLDVNPETSQLFVPGVYALVAPVPDPGPNKEYHCAGSDDDNCAVYAAQWFIITDIGLTFYEGEHDFTVLARSLRDGGALEGAKIQLVSQGNRVLAEASTDATGIAKFSRTLTTGEASNTLVAIMAETKDDFNFLSYGKERLDLSRLNVGGSSQENRTSAFVYTDRGIYQPGETIQTLALLRDRSAVPDGLAGAELRLEISDYIVKTRPIAATEWKDGGSLIPFEIPATARPGTAVIKLVSAADDVLAEARVQLGKIRPDRARIKFGTGRADAAKASVGDKDLAEITGKVSAQYLYGLDGTDQGVAANLKAEITVQVAPVATPVEGCFAGFAFGALEDEALPAVSRNYVAYTDDKGVVPLHLSGVRLPNTTKPKAATVDVTLFDSSGPLAAGRTSIAVPPGEISLGVLAAPRLTVSAAGGYGLGLDIASIGADGTARLDRDLEILVERERESYAWENVDGVWQDIRMRQREKVSSTTVALANFGQISGATSSCPGFVSVNDSVPSIGEGRYVVTVTDKASGAVASVRFSTGVAQTSVEDLEPNIFVLSSDKERYAPGEKVSLTFEAPFLDGKVLVAVAANDIVGWFPGDVHDGKGTVVFNADPAWAGRGFHTLATVFKSETGDARQLGPARAIGAAYFEVSNDNSTFNLSIQRQTLSLDDYLRPGEPMAFDVCVNGPAGGCGGSAAADGYAVAFVVDEGLLSLTGHEAESQKIENEFLGKQKLSLRLMDNYGRLLLKEGGDRPGRIALSNYTSSRIVAAVKGPVAFENGRASFRFDGLDLQSGSLKVYIVGWTPNRVGSARQTVSVHNLIVSNLGVPEFFLAGDKPALPLHLENINFVDHPGNYALSLKAEGGIKAALSRPDGTAIETNGEGSYLLPIRMSQPLDLLVSLDIPPNIEGEYGLALDMSAVDALVPLPAPERRRFWKLQVRPSSVATQEYLSFPLGSRPTDLAVLLKGLIVDRYDPSSVKVVARFASEGDALRVANVETPNVGRKSMLDDLVWLGMVGLQDQKPSKDNGLDDRVQASIDGIQALQLTDGTFVPYRTQGDFIPSEVGFDKNTAKYTIRHGLLRNVSALDFLIRAQAQGYSVSPDAIRNSTAFIEARVDEALQASDNRTDSDLVCNFDTRYAMLVLVQQGRLTKSNVEALSDCGPQDAADADESDGPATKASADDTVLSELVNMAVFSEFGDKVDPEKALAARYSNPSQYLGDLDDYRKAIALSMLANARVDPKIVEGVFQSFFSDQKPLDLRTRAWLARSVADFGDHAVAKLKASDVEASDPDLMTLTERPDGIVESQEIDYQEIERTSLAVGSVGGPNARGFLRIGGRLFDSQSSALPEKSLSRRFFNVDTGKEIDPRAKPLEVGEKLAVVIEAKSEALAAFTGQYISDIGSSYGALVVEAELPSALTLVGEDISSIKPKGDLARVTMVGNMRSVESHAQGWKATIVPQSSQAVLVHDEANSQDDEDEGGAGEREEAAVPDSGQAAPGSTAGEPGIEFRQAFIVTVTAAGSFLFPATSIDPLDFPGNTLLGQQLRLEVAVPGRAPK
ncbi:hypothetical protein NKH86_29855 [Mesorhizobium sp. M0913]|uniref:MG2 domain-containing protein n=1 Tax=Mesorhizobium sp. M0913 TaxID=2957026 RepID=UPI003336FC39